MKQISSKSELLQAITEATREAGELTTSSSLICEMTEEVLLDCFGQCDQNRDTSYISKAIREGAKEDSHSFIAIKRSDKQGNCFEICSGNHRFGMVAKKHNRPIKITLRSEGTIPDFVSRPDGKVEVRVMLLPRDAIEAKASCLVYNNPALSITAQQKRGMEFRESEIDYVSTIGKLFTQAKVITRGRNGAKAGKEKRTPIQIVKPALKFIRSVYESEGALPPTAFDFQIPLGARAELINIFILPEELPRIQYTQEQAKSFIADFLKEEPTKSYIRETRAQLSLERIDSKQCEEAWESQQQAVSDCFAIFLSDQD